MPTLILFLIAGGVSGAITAYALDMKSPREILQGVVGGLIAGLLIALLLPR